MHELCLTLLRTMCISPQLLQSAGARTVGSLSSVLFGECYGRGEQRGVAIVCFVVAPFECLQNMKPLNGSFSDPYESYMVILGGLETLNI